MPLATSLSETAKAIPLIPMFRAASRFSRIISPVQSAATTQASSLLHFLGEVGIDFFLKPL